MRLIKDITLVYFRTVGPSDSPQLLSLSALYLDRENLLERMNYSSYVKSSSIGSILAEHAATIQVEAEQLNTSPKAHEVLAGFEKNQSPDSLLATASVHDYSNLQAVYRRQHLPFPFDNQVLDLWSLSVRHASSLGWRKIPSWDSLAEHYGLPKAAEHDTLAKVRQLSDLLRIFFSYDSHI